MQTFALTTSPPLANQSKADYERVCLAMAFIDLHPARKPSRDAIAAYLGLSTLHFDQLVRRWVGLSSQEFLQAATLDRVRLLLPEAASSFNAVHGAGFSGPNRRHDLIVTHEAISPGAWNAAGNRAVMQFGFHPSPFGECITVATERGLAGLGWVDEKDAPGKAGDFGKHGGGRTGALADMKRRWPRALFIEDAAATTVYAQQAFSPLRWGPDRPLRVLLIGTDFEIRVWEKLLEIPIGRATTYSSLAHRIGNPTASRAVGAAVGKNPISFVVPCHRVLSKNGALTGYHWGIARKRAIIGWETGQRAQET